MKDNKLKLLVTILSITLLTCGCGNGVFKAPTAVDDQNIEAETTKEGKYPVKWDLSSVYSSEEEWIEDCDKVLEMYKGYDKFKGKLNTPETINDYFNFAFFGELTALQEKLGTYVKLLGLLDTTDPLYKRLSTAYSDMLIKEDEYNGFAEDEIFSLSFEERKKIFSDPVFGGDTRWLSRYLTEDFTPLSESEEEIVSNLSRGLGYGSYTFDILNDVELPYPDITMPNKEEEILDDELYLEILGNPKYSEEFKESVHKLFYSRYANFANTFASLLEQNCNEAYAFALLDGYGSTKESEFDSYGLTTDIYDMLIKTAHENLSDQHRYYELHAKACGLEKQHLQDLFIVPSDYTRGKVAYDDAVDEVTRSLEILGDDYIDHFTTMINSGHVDVYPSATKRNGAAENTYSIDYLPWVYFNYKGYSDDISTLAHEMGHAVYDMYSVENQYPKYTSPTIFTHEVASTTNELLYYTYMIDNAKDDDEKLYYLDNAINMFSGTFFRQMMYSEFEDYMYDVVENGGSLDAEEMKEKWLELSALYRGDSVEYYQEDGYYWAKVSHFYTPYYVYQYAADIAYAASIAQRITGGDQKALEDYIAFLKLGDSMPPTELLNAAGVDPLSEKTYTDAMDFYRTLLDQYEELIENR